MSKPSAVLCGVLASVASAIGGVAGEVEFTTKPTVSKADGKAAISFAVSSPTDVEVAVLDVSGGVVRHLAAGVLGGKNPPPAPLRAALAQRIVWDGTDDLRRAVSDAKGLTVRVRLGLGVKFDGLIGRNKTHIAGLWGMATDPGGHVYIYSASVGNRGPGAWHQMQVFDRAGKYVRTIVPMPANISRDRAGPFKPIWSPDDFIYPRNRWGTWPVLYPDLAYSQALAARLGEAGVLHISDGRRVARVATDGGAVGGAFARSNWSKAKRPHQTIDRYFMSYPGHVVAPPDGKSVFLTGIYQTKATEQFPMRFPPDRVYRVKTDGGEAELFATVKPAGEAKPVLAGMAFDAEGNLLVCDRAGNRIVVLDPKGDQVGSVAVASPACVACHRKTGAVYVLTTRKLAKPYQAEKHLIKFTSWKQGRTEVGRLALRPQGYRAAMALDDSADPTVLWVGIDRSKAGDAYAPDKPAAVLRLEERDGKFAPTEHEVKIAERPVRVVTRLAVHPETDQIICRGEYAAAEGFDGLTGKPIKLPFQYCADMGVGLDGNWYVQPGYYWAGWLLRFDKDLKPVPVPKPPADVGRGAQKRPAHAVGFAFGRYGSGFGTAGVTADGRGRVFSLQQIDHQTISGDCAVVFGPDGVAEDPGRLRSHPRIKKHGRFPSALFGPIAAKCGGIGVDFSGCFYVGVQALPPGHKPPAGFERDPAYLSVVGSVLKVKPEGGSLIDLGGKDARPPRKAVPIPEGADGLKLARRGGYPRGPMFAENALKAYPGLGSVSGSFGTGCRCRQPMFQVDGWGRLFIPNAITYSVRVVDNEGNLIRQFGHYGNVDSAGPDSRIPKPEIPLGWPQAVGVSRKAVYVADVLNRRIVRLLKQYAAEETCPVK